MLSWEISADWQPDPSLKTEIEVRFIPDGENVTPVELEHRHLDRYGARRDEMRCIFAGVRRKIHQVDIVQQIEILRHAFGIAVS